MNINTYKCVDVGSENCPCELAVTGDCLTCSRLQGRDRCDCDWKGVCILNEFLFNGRKANNKRKEKECAVLSKYHISGDFIVLEIGVQKGFAIRCMRPAAYLFLRSPKCDHHYDVPVSVLDVSLTRPSVTVGIRILSAKTKALDEAEKNVLVRGPYRGGMIGRKFRNRNGRILILCSGAGVCPGIFACNLLSASSEVTLVARDAPFEKEMVRRFFRPQEFSRTGRTGEAKSLKYARGGNIVFRDFESAEETEKIRRSARMERPDHIVILGSREFISAMYRSMSEFRPSADFVTSNDVSLCCGEGVCGACEITTAGGKRIRMCKCSESVDPEELFGEKAENTDVRTEQYSRP